MQKLFAALTITLATIAFAGIPWNQKVQADFTSYEGAGYGACGTKINAKTEMFVAISPVWFTNINNPNNDPMCTSRVCVKVDYKGKSITVPVKDKCPGCQKNHLDLSKPAYLKLAEMTEGHVYGATWQFVRCP